MSNVQVTRSPVYSHFAESLAGMDTIRAYGYQSRFALMSDSRVDYNHRFGPLTADRVSFPLLVYLTFPTGIVHTSVAPESTHLAE